MRRDRLVRRHHLGHTAPGLSAAVDGVLALHSSDPLTPHLGLWARCRSHAVGALDAALEAGELWRMHAMRRTLWVVGAPWAGALDAATGASIAAKERKRLIGQLAVVQDGAAAHLEAVEALALDAVAASPGRTTRELVAEIPALSAKITVGSGKWTSEVAVGTRLLMVLAMELKLARGAPAGSWKSSQYRWFRPSAVSRPPVDQARARLVAAYLHRFGPASEADVKWWTGLTLRQTRAALGAAGAVAVRLSSGPGWDAAGAPSVPPAAGVALLPGLDPTPMGHKERGWFLGAHGPRLFDRNGNVGPTAWVDGRVVGGWAVRADGTVTLGILESLDATHTAALEAEATALERWLDGMAVTPRFRTPLERALGS